MASLSASRATISSCPVNKTALRQIALAGNPNAGKTTLFNALTGMRQKVGNYPGVTVEKKEGRCLLPKSEPFGGEALILDLPGTYSLSPKSPDEEIARDVLLGLRSDTPIPDVVVVVIDASNLERNLYLATQVLELGIPTVVALNMSDVARANGKPVDAAKLSLALGAPVVELVASRGEGLDNLRLALAQEIPLPSPPILVLPEKAEAARAHLASILDTRVLQTSDADEDQVLDTDEKPTLRASGIALRLLCGNVSHDAVTRTFGPLVAEATGVVRESCEVSVARLGALEAQARYTILGKIASDVVVQDAVLPLSVSDKLDAVLTHRIWGMAIFALITLLVFQAIFSWAQIPMDAINNGVAALQGALSSHMAAGPLRDLLTDGVLAGVGAVLVFLPQILVLFFFIGILEDTGYMARAAFLMDRAMSRVGLHGRAFIPLMSSFACAIPGIMATRTISNRRDRMTTILIAPLMTCSARLPVYTLMIATFISNRALWGAHIGGHFFGLTLPAAIMFGLYAGGMLAAMGAAWVFKRTLFKGPPPTLMMELPPYKVPAWRNILVTMWDRASQFLKRAGTVILAISIVLWFLLSYPKLGANEQARAIQDFASTPTSNRVLDVRNLTTEQRGEIVAAAQLRHSFAGNVGRVVEPLIAPLGFNWKIGIGLIGAMSAREVFVSTMGTVYSVGNADETSKSLKSAMKNDRWPDGKPVWTSLVAVSLLVYFVLAMQCLSTLAVVRRETNSWKWPLFMQVYMTGLAWFASFAVYQVGRMMGWG